MKKALPGRFFYIEVIDMEYNIDDIVEMKKKHPCGSNKLQIIRFGVDFKFKCLGCEHIITVERPKALKMIKKK